MKRTSRIALYAVGGYAGFCVVNYWFSSARTGLLPVPGANAFADFNEKLLPFNLLARMLAPGGAAAAVPSMTIAPAPIPQITTTPGGTTTYWGP